MRHSKAFTLLELLVATSVLLMIVGLLLAVLNETGSIWRRTSGKIEQFREARQAFDSMMRRISEATLNTYWDYDNPTTPTRYERRSELRFLSGPANDLFAGLPSGVVEYPTGHAIFFQAPVGFTSNNDYTDFDNLLNTWGYYLDFRSDSVNRPSFVNVAERYRYRLMELMEPSESLSIYGYTSTNGGSEVLPLYNKTTWFTDPMVAGHSRVLAENIISLTILPKLSNEDTAALKLTASALAPEYRYDTTGIDENGKVLATVANPDLNPKNQLPPVVQISMVALDEASAARNQLGGTPPAYGFRKLFTDASLYDADVRTLEGDLSAMHLNYRVFTTNVSLKGAKWSRAQRN